jgi:hypothetical protein
LRICIETQASVGMFQKAMKVVDTFPTSSHFLFSALEGLLIVAHGKRSAAMGYDENIACALKGHLNPFLRGSTCDDEVPLQGTNLNSNLPMALPWATMNSPSGA